jgi:hypothetical protein
VVAYDPNQKKRSLIQRLNNNFGAFGWFFAVIFVLAVAASVIGCIATCQLFEHIMNTR